jgi:hypothetical protein
MPYELTGPEMGFHKRKTKNPELQVISSIFFGGIGFDSTR